MVTDRNGTILLEAVIALAVVSVAAVVLLSLALQSVASAEQLRYSEERLVAASVFLDKVALWSSIEYDQRLGERQQGEWRLRILRPAPALYDLTLMDASGVELLRTAQYRKP